MHCKSVLRDGMGLTHVILRSPFLVHLFARGGERFMVSDDLFARAERAITESRLLRDERRLLEKRLSTIRRALRAAVIEMVNLRAAIEADRRLSALRGSGPNSPDWADAECLDIERLECLKDYARSQQETLRALAWKLLN
jgi:hypothetical protein